MYQLTVKETHSSKTWSVNLDEVPNGYNRPFQANRAAIQLATILFLGIQPELCKVFRTVLRDSTAKDFYISVEEVKINTSEQEPTSQTVSVFKGMDVIPESGRELVLHMATGQFLAPAIYKKGCGHFHIPGGEARPYMIKEWAYQDELTHLLLLKPADPETLEKLNKRAEQDKTTDKGLTPDVILDALAKSVAEMFPESRVKVHKI